MTAIDTKSQLPTLDPPATGGDAADPDVAMARRLAFGASTSLEHEPDVDRPEGRSWASRTIAIAGGLAAGIAVLAVLAVTAVPADLVKARLISGIEAETGRKLSVNGRTSVVLFPGLAVKMTDVTLSSPESMNVQPLARVAAVDADVALWPLLAGRIEIRRLHLDRPVIELIVDSKGDRSWEVAAAAGPARVSVAAIEPARGGSGTTSDAGTSVLVPAARVWHVHSGTSGEGSPFKSYHLARNKTWLVLKNCPAGQLLRDLPWLVGYDLAFLLWAIAARRDLASLRGRIDAWRALPQILRARQAVQRRRRLPAMAARRALSPVEPPWQVLARYRHLPTGVSANRVP